MRKNAAAVASRTTPTTSGEKPASAPLVATGPRPQQAAAQVPSANPASRARRCSGVTPRTKHDGECRSKRERSLAARAIAATRHGPIPRPPAPASERQARYVLSVLVLVYVFNFLDRQILAILAERIRFDLNVTDAELGFLYGTAFAVFYAVFGIPLGRLADVWDRRLLIRVGLPPLVPAS